MCPQARPGRRASGQPEDRPGQGCLQEGQKPLQPGENEEAPGQGGAQQPDPNPGSGQHPSQLEKGRSAASCAIKAPRYFSQYLAT